MKSTTKALRRSLYCCVRCLRCRRRRGGCADWLTPSRQQPPPPDPCAASEVARTIGSVATSTGNYLDSHPQTNQALTTISQQQAGPQSLARAEDLLRRQPASGQGHAAAAAAAGQPVHPVQAADHLPQLMGLMQAAQQQGGALPAVCQAALPTAQTVGVPGAALPAQSSPASAVTQGSGPLPGPATTTTR